jgi:hypothetical protein
MNIFLSVAVILARRYASGLICGPQNVRCDAAKPMVSGGTQAGRHGRDYSPRPSQRWTREWRFGAWDHAVRPTCANKRVKFCGPGADVPIWLQHYWPLPSSLQQAVNRRRTVITLTCRASARRRCRSRHRGGNDRSPRSFRNATPGFADRPMKRLRRRASIRRRLQKEELLAA